MAFITNHSYLKNPTFRGMREQLLEDFDEIYIMDLHGNRNRSATTPDGRHDQNVCNIRQGVAIGIYIKHDGEGGEDSVADVYHTDVWGTREEKYEFLRTTDFEDVSWEEATPQEPFFVFEPRDQALADDYHKWVSIPNIFSEYGDPAPGIVTTHKEFAISLTAERQKEKVRTFLDTDTESEAREYYNLCSQDQWLYNEAKTHLSRANWEDKIVEIQEQPFDKQYTVYDSHVAVHRRTSRLSKHMLAGENISLSVPRRTELTPFDHAFVCDGLMTHHGVSNKEINYQFPLYLYPNAPDEVYEPLDNPDRTTNINGRLLSELSTQYSKTIQPEQVFNYTYAILYAPSYRLTYSQFMESDFPKIPFPEDSETFDILVGLGEQLTELHLLKHPCLQSPGVRFEGDGDNRVSERTGKYYRHYDEETERFYLNSDQYFAPVPEDVWKYEIGNRPIVETWIQARIREELSLDDIMRFCKIVRAVQETLQIQEEIDKLFPTVESNYTDINLDGQQTLDT